MPAARRLPVPRPRRTPRRRRAVSTLASILAPMIHYPTGCKGSVPFPATSGADTVPLSLIRIGEGESARGESLRAALLDLGLTITHPHIPLLPLLRDDGAVVGQG